MRTFLIAAVLSIGAIATAPAQQSQDASPVYTLLPTLVDIHMAATRSAHANCMSAPCHAIISIDHAMDIMMDALATTMGDAKPIPPDRDRVAQRRFRNAILSHPKLFVPICSAAVSLVGRYPGPAGEGDLFVAVGLIELATRIEIAGTPCLAPVIAAFPRSPKATTAIDNAHKLCVNDWKLAAECERVSRDAAP